MRIGRVDIPDERFHAVCDMGAAAVGLLTVLCAESDESGMVTMSVRDIAKSLNMRKSTVCETLHTIADIGVADVVTRRGSGTSICFPNFSKVVPVADTLGQSGSRGGHFGQSGSRGGHFGQSGSRGGHFGQSNFVCTSTTHTKFINNTNNIIKSNSVTNNAYACTREETPVEKLEKEDREEAARLRETIRYPTKWEEVRDAAVAYAIPMDEEEADGFLAKYASVGWVKAGAKIRDWRYLLQSWHRNWQQVEKDKEKKTQGRTKNARNEFGQADFSGNYGPPTEYADF